MSWVEVIKTNTIPWELLLKIKWVNPDDIDTPRNKLQFVNLPNVGWLGMYVQKAPPEGVNGVMVEDDTILINWNLLTKEAKEAIDDIWEDISSKHPTKSKIYEEKYTEDYGTDKTTWPLLGNNRSIQDEMINEFMDIIHHESIHKTFRGIPYFDLEAIYGSGTAKERIKVAENKVFEEISVSLLEGKSWQDIHGRIIEKYVQSEFGWFIQHGMDINDVLRFFREHLANLKKFDSKLRIEVAKYREKLLDETRTEAEKRIIADKKAREKRYLATQRKGSKKKKKKPKKGKWKY